MLDPKFTANQQREKKNLSFATQKLENLPPLAFRLPQKPAKNLIFIHFSKTGGTNLHYVAEALAKISDFKYKRFWVPKNPLVPNASPILVYVGYKGGLASAQAALTADPNCCNNLDLISGHFPFGLHKEAVIPAQYITLLGDPVERAISGANFDNQRGFVSDELVNDYLLQAGIDNPQTRMLAGLEYMSGECNQETLAKARANIEQHFLLAGVKEDTNTFIQALASIQGWGPLSLVKAQVTGKKIISNPSSDVIKQLQEKHRFDKELYEWVKARWYKWKEENIASSQVETDQKYLCITAEFSTTSIPFLMTANEIEAYNQRKTSELIQIDQILGGIPSTPSAAPVVPHFEQKKSEVSIETEPKDPKESYEKKNVPRWPSV